VGLKSVHYLQVQATAFVDEHSIDAARAEQIALIEASMLAPSASDRPTADGLDGNRHDN
jgi:hypothetical protein